MTDIRRYGTLDSTNEEARRLAAEGERGPVWILAERQTNGRGRRGRFWVSDPGNLFATLLREVDAPLEACGQLSFAAALSVADVIAGYVPGTGVTLKWPNDILLNRRKAAGILLEATPTGPVTRLIVGIGVNLAHHPRGTEFPATSLAQGTDRAPSPESALVRLVAAWDTWYETWRETGFAPLRAAWLARAEGFGKRVTVRIGNSQIDGIFEDMEQDGALLLHVDGGKKRRVTAGEVFFGS